jgi:hypothetical protein
MLVKEVMEQSILSFSVHLVEWNFCDLSRRETDGRDKVV